MLSWTRITLGFIAATTIATSALKSNTYNMQHEAAGKSQLKTFKEKKPIRITDKRFDNGQLLSQDCLW